MRHFIANIIAMLFIFPKYRRRVRCKIMGKSNVNLQNKYNYNKLKAQWLEHNNNTILIPGRFYEYDLVFAIGATCHVTTILDYFKLRRFSTPFDWTGGTEPDKWHSSTDVYRDSRFREKIQAICDNFKDFVNPEYLQPVSQYLPPATPHLYIINSKVHVRWMHEFPANQSMEQHLPEFVEKMARRIKHFYDAINKSNKILIVWISSIADQRAQLEQNVSDADIKWAIKQMQKMYPDKIFDFVFFEPDGTKEKFEYDKIEVAPGAFRIKSNHFLIDSEYDVNCKHAEHLPYPHVISEALDNIHLSNNAFKLPDNALE